MRCRPPLYMTRGLSRLPHPLRQMRAHTKCVLYFHARPNNLRTTLSRINSLHGGTTYGYYLRLSLVWIPEHPGGDLHGLDGHSGPAVGRYGYLN